MQNVQDSLSFTQRLAAPKPRFFILIQRVGIVVGLIGAVMVAAPLGVVVNTIGHVLVGIGAGATAVSETSVDLSKLSK